MISGRSGLASTSAGLGRTGRRFAKRPRPLRRPRSPCSGRGLSGSVVSHFGPADGSEQHGVGLAALLEDLVGERDPVLVDRGAADEVLLVGEVADGVEDLDGGRDDLGADPVAGQERDVPGGAHAVAEMLRRM